MGGLALGLIIVVGVILGIVAQLIGVARSGYDGLITGIAIVGGAIVAGQWLGGLSTSGPQIDGLFLLPALIGGVVLAVIADLVVRLAFPAVATT